MPGSSQKCVCLFPKLLLKTFCLESPKSAPFPIKEGVSLPELQRRVLKSHSKFRRGGWLSPGDVLLAGPGSATQMKKEQRISQLVYLHMLVTLWKNLLQKCKCCYCSKIRKRTQNQSKILVLPDARTSRDLLSGKFQTQPLRNSMGLNPLSNPAWFLKTSVERPKPKPRTGSDLRSPKIEYRHLPQETPPSGMGCPGLFWAEKEQEVGLFRSSPKIYFITLTWARHM